MQIRSDITEGTGFPVVSIGGNFCTNTLSDWHGLAKPGLCVFGQKYSRKFIHGYGCFREGTISLGCRDQHALPGQSILDIREQNYSLALKLS